MNSKSNLKQTCRGLTCRRILHFSFTRGWRRNWVMETLIFMHSFINYFIQQILAQCLQWVRQCSRHFGYSYEQDGQDLSRSYWWQEVLEISLSNQILSNRIDIRESLKGFKQQNDFCFRKIMLVQTDIISVAPVLGGYNQNSQNNADGNFDDWLI